MRRWVPPTVVVSERVDRMKGGGHDLIREQASSVRPRADGGNRPLDLGGTETSRKSRVARVISACKTQEGNSRFLV